jgi:hypothetical protein
MSAFLAALMMLPASLAITEGAPDGARAAAREYVDMLTASCPGDPQRCTQKFRLESAEDLRRAKLGEPWAALVLTFEDFRKTPFQDLMNTARFNYYACPIVIDGQFKGIVRVCADPDEADKLWVSCGSRGPTRVAEINTYNLTLAPESDSLYVECVLTVQNNARYIVVRQAADYYAIPASDQAAEMMQVHVRHVSRMTMFPLAEALYKVGISVQQRDTRRR